MKDVWTSQRMSTAIYWLCESTKNSRRTTSMQPADNLRYRDLHPAANPAELYEAPDGHWTEKLKSNLTYCRCLRQREGSTRTVWRYHRGSSIRHTLGSEPSVYSSVATDVKYDRSDCIPRAERFLTRRTLLRTIGRFTASQFRVIDRGRLRWSCSF